MKPVLVGCSHGTDSDAGRAAIRAILAGVRAARPDLDVREAFVDVQEPEVADVVGAAVGAGLTAVVVPLFLSVGYHVRVDIAAAVANRPAVAVHPLGPDPRLVEVLLDRLATAGARGDDAIVLAAAGSTDARAAVAVTEIATALDAAWGGGPITIGYGAGASPRVPAALATAREAGTERVVIAAYLLAPGFFHDRLLDVGADVVTEPLAPDPRLVQIVLDRYAEGVAQLTAGAPAAGRPVAASGPPA
ncbi:sirohydrochlorin chelatase [Pengzhenrongella sicca]|uniref:Sirohydrochlorin chelatase n=1 Tax=Pengzhenrongella sicca TaxID=2819238 RepID=A0A8A4ZBJ9_9MICO|nr:sirohydrochlorin chelatase [Pengzhenrongella sicca]QTE28253.1 sirohydrochlorin chelatase [Pengzhenrongella sicca]